MEITCVLARELLSQGVRDGASSSFRHSGEATGLLQLRNVLISPVESPISYLGYAIRWGEQSNLPRELLRSFYVAQHCMTSHCCAQSEHPVRVMTQRIGCALEPLLIAPKKEVGERLTALYKKDARVQRI